MKLSPRRLSVPGYPEATVLVTISRSSERFENPASDAGRPEGLLVKGRRAIYENSLFGCEGNPHAHWFAGSIACEEIDRLALEFDNIEFSGKEHDQSNPMPIISRSRDGLEHEHPFYVALAALIDPILATLAKEEEKKAQEGEVRESAKLRRSLDILGRDLAQLIDADLREIDENGLEGGSNGGDKSLIRIIPANPVLYMGEDKTLSVVVNRSIGASELNIEVDPEGVIEVLDFRPIPLLNHPHQEGFQIARIHIRPIIEDEQTFLTVRCGEIEEVAIIEVKPEREDPDPDPPSDLEFERDRYRLAHGKRRFLHLRAPIEVINESASMIVRVVSSDPGVVVMGDSITLVFSEDEACFVGQVSIDPRVLGAHAKLTATMGEVVRRVK